MLPWALDPSGGAVRGPVCVELRGAVGVLRAPRSRGRCRCRCGGPRGGRRAGAGRGHPVQWQLVLRSAPVGLRRAPVVRCGAPVVHRGAPVGLRRAPLVLRSAPMPPNPVGSGSPRPRGGLVCRARGPARRAPEGGWSVGPGRAAAPPFRRGVGWGVLGVARRALSPLRREVARLAASVVPRPRRGLAPLWPPVVGPTFRGKPRAVRCSAGHRPSEEGRALCIAG